MNNKEKNIKISENEINNEVNVNSKTEISENKPSLTPDTNLDEINETDKLSQSLKNLLLLDKDFSKPVIIEKQNQLFTDFHYATFKNSYAENTCYINVILHLLYNIEQLEEFIETLYKIDESNKRSSLSKSYNYNYKTNKEETNDTYNFLVLIGKILSEYKEIIYNEDDNNILKRRFDKNKQVFVINTLRMRKMLEKVSKGQFALNTIADPVEFFGFILDILNEYLNEDIHKTFYLELIDEYICDNKGCSQIINNKYDKDNFMYHIYIDEILKFIEKENIKVFNFKYKLFEFSHNLFISENTKNCEKCKQKMKHNLICKNLPDYILINCVWRESNPIVDDALTLFFMMPLRDEFNNLFIHKPKSYRKNYYYLFGFILYSFTLSHYIICIYNLDKKVFVLLNDEIVKEFHNLYELLLDITVDTLKETGKAFFYPVMLIYTKDALYDPQSMKTNTLNNSEYQDIINKCNEAIYQFEMESKANEEEKSNNYKEFIKKQKEIEDEIIRNSLKKSKYESYRKLKKAEIEPEEKKENKELKQKLNFDYEEKEQRINNDKNINEIKEEKNIVNDNNNIKRVLEQKNIGTIGRILKDIKEIRGKNISENLYVGDLMKSKEYNNRDIINHIKENEILNKEINKDNNLDNNKNRNSYLYKSNIIWNNTNNKTLREISKIGNNLENNNKYNIKRNENNINNSSTANNPVRTTRFHRKISTGLDNNINNINNNPPYLNNYRNIYSNNETRNGTQIGKRYHFIRSQNNP